MKLLSCLLRTSRWPQRVLAISKPCVFEFLKTAHPVLSDNQLLDRLRKLSKECDEMIAEHRRQLACERELARVLRNLDVSYRIVKRIADASGYMDWADLVITIGKDGTFLSASRLITNNETPIFGINPHPGTGDSLALPMEYSADIDGIMERLRAGDYSLLMRSRIRTIMTGVGLYRQPLHMHEKSRTRDEKRINALHASSTRRKIGADGVQSRRRVLPWLALNEVSMAEFLTARLITLAIQANNEKELTIRSSGVCVCTGSGSQSWFKQMNLQSADTIQTVVAMATGRELSRKETGELLYKYRSNLLFPPEDPRMAYRIYEMFRRKRCSTSLSERRRCHTIRVKSFGFDAGLVLDGCVCMPFNDGSTALFEIRPEYSLKNIVLR